MSLWPQRLNSLNSFNITLVTIIFGLRPLELLSLLNIIFFICREKNFLAISAIQMTGRSVMKMRQQTLATSLSNLPRRTQVTKSNSALSSQLVLALKLLDSKE